MESQVQSHMQSGMHSQMQDTTASQLPAREPKPAHRKNESIYDKWLLIRFCICFVLLW
jgi:hypothetical protein